MGNVSKASFPVNKDVHNKKVEAAPAEVTTDSKISKLFAKFKQFFSDIKKAIALKSSLKSSLKSEVKAIKNKQNWRFSGESIAKILIAKHKDPEQLQLALNNVLIKDSRFNGSDKNFKLDENEVNSLITHLNEAFENKTVKTDKKIKQLCQNKLAKADKKRAERRQKIEKHLRNDLVGLLHRSPSIVEFNDTVTFTQQQGHISQRENGALEFLPGKTLSAELQKTEVEVRETANLGTISTGDKVILTRSSRTDTPEKITEKSVADIAERLSKGQLEPDENGNYNYQRVDVTFIDKSFLKAIATQVITGIKAVVSKMKGKSSPIENERQFLYNKRAAIKQMWNSKDVKTDKGRKYLERQVVFAAKDGGVKKEVTVREYKPIVINHVMSGQAKKPKGVMKIFGNNVKAARKDNMDAYTQLFGTVIKKHTGSATLDIAFENYQAEPSKENRTALLSNLIDFIPMAKAEHPQLAIGLEAALMLIKGTDADEKSIDDARGSGLQFLATAILTDLAGHALSVECKSGNDRTATGIALKMALVKYEEIKGKPFDIQHANEAEMNDFKGYFVTSMQEFGRPNVLASRGKGGKNYDKEPKLKTKTSPVFQEFGGTGIGKDSDWWRDEGRVTLK